MSIETRTSRLVKKTGVEKSRWTVPLSEQSTKAGHESITEVQYLYTGYIVAEDHVVRL
jgi:hypothetical protein